MLHLPAGSPKIQIDVKGIYRLLICCICFMALVPLNAQDFPDSWSGRWAGTVEIWSHNTIIDSFPMSVTISPADSSWDYTLIYDRPGAEQLDQRNYSLISINDSLGHYAIDEHNSIILDSYLFGDCFYSPFSGMNTDLMVRICRMGPMELSYEITSAHEEPIRLSGGEVIGNDTIISINSYEVFNVMRARLFLQP